MNRILNYYENMLDSECLPIQQREINKVDKILKETGFCIIAGYHGSGKSSLARRYSHYRKSLRKVYCKNIPSQDVNSELENDDQPLFLDSVTGLLYDENFFQKVSGRAKKYPVVLGVHIEPGNINHLFNQHPDNLILVGSLDYDDARLLAGYPFKEVPNLDRLLQYSGMRRRDLINLCVETYSIRGDLNPESVEEGTANLVYKSQRVYRHIFEEHFTNQQKELIKTILTGGSYHEESIDTEILLGTGMIKEENGRLILNGKLLELIFKKILS